MHTQHLQRTALKSKARIALGLSLAITLAALSACSSETDELADLSAPLPDISIEGFETVTAELDYDKAIATSPITPFVLPGSFETQALTIQAIDAVAGTCMRSIGFELNTLTAAEWESRLPRSDRLYGQWNRAEAAIFGFDLNPDRGLPRQNTVDQGQEYTDALNQCYADAYTNEELAPLLEIMNGLTIADRIQGNSSSRAENSAVGKAAHKKHLQCMKDKSIVVNEQGYPSSDYSDLGKDSEITAVLAQVDCNISSGRIQTLYDTAAKYEAAYMKKYEEQLDAVLELKQQTYDSLRSIISANQ